MSGRSTWAANLATFAVVGSALVVTVNLLFATAEQPDVYRLGLSALVLGALALLQLLVLLVRAFPAPALLAPPLLRPGSQSEDPAPLPPELKRWDAALISASTGGRRGRARLARRIEPLLVAQVAHELGVWPEDPRVREAVRSSLDSFELLPPRVAARREGVLTALEELLDHPWPAALAPGPGGAR